MFRSLTAYAASPPVIQLVGVEIRLGVVTQHERICHLEFGGQWSNLIEKGPGTDMVRILEFQSASWWQSKE